MLYHLYELNQAALSPARAAAEVGRLLFRNPLNPASHTPFGRSAAAALELFERTTRRYRKPVWGIETTTVDGREVSIRERTVMVKPFCNLVHFERDVPAWRRRKDNKVLIVAPLAGHYPTLLRSTVRDMLPDHEVYITEWEDARNVPRIAGSFDLDDYIDYLMDFFRHFRGDVHVMAVCQPTVPVFAAVSLMEAANDPHVPHSMVLMAGPIDARENPTSVNEFAVSKTVSWFQRNVITQVPWPQPGVLRNVYPGFLQLTGFMGMNFGRHLSAHRDHFHNLIKGDGDSAEKHREFYDEFLAVMDLTEEFYLQTIESVFIEHRLPKGEMIHRNRRVDPSKIRRVALMTVEGEKDDITGLGQTFAAHNLCANLPETMRAHHEQAGAGHYGVFNGRRFRTEIAPKIKDFMAAHTRRRGVLARAFSRNA
ncbi:MAG TPA: polyhydroxyalkanoate depolymerase [Methyloceanibacter sp.]|jgi:poly(3-hydroxybutyrate) depolymerase|nr:polyhydroxyalkanoate depolymerase [Methyloceanibacter sp.]